MRDRINVYFPPDLLKQITDLADRKKLSVAIPSGLPAGLYTVLHDFSTRWPDLPLTVTESGIATELGTRRAEMIVRALEQIDKVKAEGGDVRGYYHWSVYDNFEWSYGFVPRFGLYRVDFNSYARTATEGATVLGEIAGARKLSPAQRKKYGGSGAMTPEPGAQ